MWLTKQKAFTEARLEYVWVIWGETYAVENTSPSFKYLKGLCGLYWFIKLSVAVSITSAMTIDNSSLRWAEMGV